MQFLIGDMILVGRALIFQIGGSKNHCSTFESMTCLFPRWNMLVFGRVVFCNMTSWVVVSNMFYSHPYLGKIPILTSIFFKGVETTK